MEEFLETLIFKTKFIVTKFIVIYQGWGCRTGFNYTSRENLHLLKISLLIVDKH